MGICGSLENGFDGLFEYAREGEGEGQARVVAARFDGVDGLARDVKAHGQIGLRPIALGSQDSKAILHRRQLTATGAQECVIKLAS